MRVLHDSHINLSGTFTGVPSQMVDMLTSELGVLPSRYQALDRAIAAS